MIPNMYKIAGELLPGVFHVIARTLATHALCIFGDHGDVMAGQDRLVLHYFAHHQYRNVWTLQVLLIYQQLREEFHLHFFDGFQNSHEIQKIEVIDHADLAKLVDMDAVQAFRKDHALNPEHPVIRGTAQNPDIFSS